MADEIKTRITVEGDEAVRDIKNVSGAEKQLAKDVKNSGNAAADAGKKHGGLGRAFSGLKTQIVGLVTGAASISVLTGALRANTAAINENADAANRLKRAQLDLQFLSQGYRADELRATQAAAGLVGGPNAMEEMQGVFAELKSKTALMSDEDRINLFEQLVETSMTTSASPSTLVGLYSKGSQYISDPERLQAIIRKSQELSPAASPAVLGQLLPRILATSKEVGMLPEEAAGLLVSALTIDEASGATSLRNIMTILGGGTTPEGAGILKGAGAMPGGGILNQLDALAKGGLSVEGMTKLVGRENFVTFAGLLNQQTYRGNIGGIMEASLGTADPTREAIQNIISQDKQQALRLKTAQAEARIQSQMAGDVDAQRGVLGIKLYEELMREEGTPSFLREFNLMKYNLGVGVGLNPETAASLSIFDPGYEWFKNKLNGLPDLDVGEIGRAYRGEGATVNIGTQINGTIDPNVALPGRDN